jgi:hypothetical protein
MVKLMPEAQKFTWLPQGASLALSEMALTLTLVSQKTFS